MQTQLDLSTKPRARAALQLASQHHFGIERKYCGEPYIHHPIRVAERLVAIGLGSSEDVICAALLHDCMEDKNKNGVRMAPLVIERECGPKVRRYVEALTKLKAGNRARTNEVYTKQLLAAPIEIQAVKLADILDNITGLAKADPDFAPTYLDEKEEQARTLLPTCAGGPFTDLKRSVLDQIGAERNELAVVTLNAMRLFQAERERDAAEIQAIIAEEEAKVYADYALF
jgi:guanosine-3',5'-bis(diphosphate) 3'-pyrophosphohydrolase